MLGKRSPHWRTVRRAHLKVEYWCRVCGSTNGLEVHHVIPFHLKPELELMQSNLITLCEHVGTNHHLKIGHNGDFHSFNPDVRKDAAFPEP